MGDGADDFERRAEREQELEGVVDAEYSAELVPTGGAPTTLFRTDDPIEIVQRATRVANALSDVLKQRNLTTRIGNKDHVQVEGWTLCGSMLGVFAVVQWTRKLDNGWEARVEARTRDGAVVGAAEAECLNTENRWKTADDYAIRSMAQTRAISKALRAPLGFVIHLAGFAATPAEEMTSDYIEAAPKPFDPEKDLAPGAPTTRAQIAAEFNRFDPTIDWGVVGTSLREAAYGKTELKGDELKDFYRRLANSAWFIGKDLTGDFPPVSTEQLKAAFAYGFSGATVEVVYKEAEQPLEKAGDAALSPKQQEQAKAALAKNEDVEFGEKA